ncbi:phospho-N-acetylmuramoyl-pentapeptide-transferase [Lapidilactobacillus gannanensis]|uniref:Phospho-N-acetylmuramoyl-pentapeptide-transferase n=1 Tax=Lapidilactobacillus gannanensis TaxID=2486002 RepID=A0ABW4BP48_9LACO
MQVPIVALISACLLTSLILPFFISYQRRHDEGQQIREEGPKWHAKKSGTPIMGGLVFLSVIILVLLVLGAIFHQLTTSLWLFILVIFLYGAIGFSDDFIKLAKKRNMGLTAIQKFSAQILTAVLFLVILMNDHQPHALPMPGTLNPVQAPIIFAIFVGIWLVGFSNAVNLSDGLDGLAGGLNVIAYGSYAVLAYRDHNQVMLMVCLAVVGALVGFLFFNHKPAQIFMGDVGSLALGGGLAAISVILQRPWSLLLIGLVFVLETASVILQVGSFKLFHRRIFLMTPIHHHFEKLGWSETKVVIVFWLVGLLSSILYLSLFH